MGAFIGLRYIRISKNRKKITQPFTNGLREFLELDKCYEITRKTVKYLFF